MKKKPVWEAQHYHFLTIFIVRRVDFSWCTLFLQSSNSNEQKLVNETTPLVSSYYHHDPSDAFGETFSLDHVWTRCRCAKTLVWQYFDMQMFSLSVMLLNNIVSIIQKLHPCSQNMCQKYTIQLLNDVTVFHVRSNFKVCKLRCASYESFTLIHNSAVVISCVCSKFYHENVMHSLSLKLFERKINVFDKYRKSYVKKFILTYLKTMNGKSYPHLTFFYSSL